MSMKSSNRFHLAELLAFAESSESLFVFTVFLNVILLPIIIFISLILSITIFDRIVHFGILVRFTISLLRRLDRRVISLTFISGGTNCQIAYSPFIFIQFIKDFPHQRSVQTCLQHRLGPVALHYCPDFLHESNSVHITATLCCGELPTLLLARFPRKVLGLRFLFFYFIDSFIAVVLV